MEILIEIVRHADLMGVQINPAHGKRVDGAFRHASPGVICQSRAGASPIVGDGDLKSQFATRDGGG